MYPRRCDLKYHLLTQVSTITRASLRRLSGCIALWAASTGSDDPTRDAQHRGMQKSNFRMQDVVSVTLEFSSTGLVLRAGPRTVQHGATVAAHERGLTERFLRVPLVQLSQLHRCHSSRCSTNGVTSARNKEIAREASIGRQ